jgi:hypothetical protein
MRIRSIAPRNAARCWSYCSRTTKAMPC